MSDSEQIAHFASDLHSLIQRYQAEYDLTLASAIGTLEVVKLQLFQQQTKLTEEDEDQD